MTITKEFGIGDNNSTVIVSPHEQFKIRLPENPTTGYGWQLEPIVGLVIDVHDTYTSAGSAVGAGGERVFVLKPLSTGCAELRLALRRSWEPPEKAIKQFTMSIVAQ